MKSFNLFQIQYLCVFYYICTTANIFAVYRLKSNSHSVATPNHSSEYNLVNYSTNNLNVGLGQKDFFTVQNDLINETKHSTLPKPNLIFQTQSLNNRPSWLTSSGNPKSSVDSSRNFFNFKANIVNKIVTDSNNLEIQKKYEKHQISSHPPPEFKTVDLVHDDIIYYPLNTTFYKVVTIPSRASSKVVITSIDNNYADFLVVQAHSQNNKIVLSFDRQPIKEKVVNSTNAGLIIFIKKFENSLSDDKIIYASNYHDQDISILLFVRNYTDEEPVPGGLFSINSTQSLPHPYLLAKQNLLTTLISFPLAVIYNISYPSLTTNSNKDDTFTPFPLSPSSSIKYKVFLTYMYEGDLFEEHLFQTIIKTSTVDGLKKNAVKVSEISDHRFTSEWIHELFVSYSGVGAVVNVIASFNGSQGVLYSSTVFYGCDFIEKSKYNCTKLVSSLAKLFCASLLFIGLILLFVGHRWLNFTMFISGFLASWFILFIIFVQVPNPNLEALEFFTLFGAIVGGIGWLVIWHKFHRPFYSALLIILLSSFFAAMISTHFLKYALVPSRENLAAFVVFPIAFSVTIIGYSIFDIKNIHIFSCCVLGSYGVVMPFAFYFGSSLTYIVINVISVMSVRRFSQAVGFPPFQYCDIVLLCVWVVLFILGIGYQVYRERAGPPFYPPNASIFRAVLSAFTLVKDKLLHLLMCSSCRQPSDDDDSLFEDRPYFFTRFSCFRSDSSGERISEYESFPRIGSDEGSSSFKEAVIRPFRNMIGFLQEALARSRQRLEERDGIREALNGRETEDIQPLETEDVSRETEFEEDPVRV